MDFTGEDEVTSEDGVHGLARVSRHAGLWSFAAVMAGAAVATPSVPQAAFLSMPVLVALVGGGHQDSRSRRGIGPAIPPEYEAKTSSVPFFAMLTGAQGGSAFSNLYSETKLANAALGVCLAAFLAAGRLR